MAEEKKRSEPIKLPTTPEEKRAARDKAKALLNKAFGAGTVMTLGDAKDRLTVRVIPTQSLRLNRALGVGGVPRSRIIEIYGPESCGKSGIAMGICAQAQQAGGIVGYIDMEHTLDPIYAKIIGLNLDDLDISQPDCAEDALEVADGMICSGAYDVVVIDSVSALVPRAELEGEMGKQTVGVQARLMSQAMRKLTGNIAKSGTVCIFINQIREKVGVMYGNPETTSGGRALKFYASMRLEVRRGENLTRKDEIYGHTIKVSVKKNKVAAPFKKADFDVIYGEGIDVISEIADVAIEEDVIKQAGSYCMLIDPATGKTKEGCPDLEKGLYRWQGKEKLKEYFRTHPAFYQEIYNALMAKLAVGDGKAESFDPDATDAAEANLEPDDDKEGQIAMEVES